MKLRLTLIAVLGGMPLAAIGGELDASTSGSPTLEQRVLALEDELAATRSALEVARSDVAATQGASNEGSSPFDGFFDRLEVGGHVTTSYLYNFNNPDSNTFSQTLCQFNCNHNEFSLDAVKLELGRAASAPGEAGFQVDLLWGQNADIFRALSPDGGSSISTGAGDTSVFIQEAYVSYNYNDIVFQFGKWETLLGWELIDSHLNYNVTHGILFTWAIPLFHTGLLASGSLGENVGWALGVTNGFNNSIDGNDNKGFVGQLSWSSGPFFTSLSTYIGDDQVRVSNTAPGGLQGSVNNRMQVYDWVLQYTPNERLDSWLNVDYGFQEVDPSVNAAGRIAATDEDAQWFGVAAGLNYQLTEKFNVAVRGEYFLDDGDFRFASGGLAAAGGGCGTVAGFCDEITAVSGTLTLGYQLTENLKARLEYRHDWVDGDPGDTADFFPSHEMDTKDEDDYAVFEVNYVFD